MLSLTPVVLLLWQAKIPAVKKVALFHSTQILNVLWIWFDFMVKQSLNRYPGLQRVTGSIVPLRRDSLFEKWKRTKHWGWNKMFILLFDAVKSAERWSSEGIKSLHHHIFVLFIYLSLSSIYWNQRWWSKIINNKILLPLCTCWMFICSSCQ